MPPEHAGESRRPELARDGQELTTVITLPRRHQGPNDLDAMRRILIAGRQTAGPVSYVHIGDLKRDLIVIAPGGQAAAFCISWIYDVNRIGHFEPVGTRAAFHRQELGKALLREGLRLMRARGMETATVCPDAGSAAARALYRSAGFGPIHRLLHFYRVLS